MPSISDRVCKRPWNFERVPNSMIEGHDKALIFTSTKEACLAACLNEKNFVCRSAEYNYVTLQERDSVLMLLIAVLTTTNIYFSLLALYQNQ